MTTRKTWKTPTVETLDVTATLGGTIDFQFEIATFGPNNSLSTPGGFGTIPGTGPYNDD